MGTDPKVNVIGTVVSQGRAHCPLASTSRAPLIVEYMRDT